MAVDFSLLPTSEAPQDSAPSRFVWTVAFFVMALAGVFSALFFWPKDMPTQTWKFWTCLVVFPLGIPAWIILRRYSVHEGRKLDATLSDEAVQNFHANVFEAASIPLVLIGAAHRFSADREENAAKGIKHGAVALKTQDPIADNGDPVQARWLVTPGMRATSGSEEDDRTRHRLVTAWLFGELLDEILPRLQAMPARVPLVIHLSLSNGLARVENENLWWDSWRARSLRSADQAPATQAPASLMLLDTWLDETLRDTNLHATLFVAVQLHPLLAARPLAGTSEAGAVVLLVPDSLARQHRIPHLATLHRPVQGPLEQPDDALSHALTWADVRPAGITGGWQTGLDATQAGALREPARKLGLSAPATDLNQTVGYAGVAAPWLALACAASWLSNDRTAQLILVGQKKHLDCAVLKPTSDEATRVSQTGLCATPSLNHMPQPRRSRDPHE